MHGSGAAFDSSWTKYSVLTFDLQKSRTDHAEYVAFPLLSLVTFALRCASQSTDRGMTTDPRILVPRLRSGVCNHPSVGVSGAAMQKKEWLARAGRLDARSYLQMDECMTRIKMHF